MIGFDKMIPFLYSHDNTDISRHTCFTRQDDQLPSLQEWRYAYQPVLDREQISKSANFTSRLEAELVEQQEVSVNY